MPMQRCDNGHAYDDSKHTSCPYCGIDGFDPGPTRARSTSENTTRSLNQSQDERSKGDDVTVPRGGVGAELGQESGSGDEKRTVGLMFKEKGVDPVVGWLVCTIGADKGRDYRVRSGRNTIGRSRQMDIHIAGDDSISRDNHASIAYDQKHNNFTLIPGEGRELIYLNGDALYQPATLARHDKIEMGNTTLRFIPFCDDTFAW